MQDVSQIHGTSHIYLRGTACSQINSKLPATAVMHLHAA